MRRLPALRLLQHPLHDPDLIGGALGDKMIRYALLARGKDPVLWDFGSAVKHHQQYSQWVPTENYRPASSVSGAVAPTVGLMADAVKEIKSLLVEAGVAAQPVGVDIVEPAFLFEMQRQGLTVVDCQQLMLDARVIKSQDEIMLLNQAAAMVDGVYQDIVEMLKPGIQRTRSSRTPTSGSTRWAPTRSRPSTRSPVSGATRTRTTSPTGSSAPATRRSSTSSTRTTATGPATTAPSRWAARRLPSATPTRRPASGWTAVWPASRPASDRRGRGAAAQGRGVRLRERDGGLRAAVRPRPRARPARAADHLAAELDEGAGRAAARHGVRPGDLLPGQ